MERIAAIVAVCSVAALPAEDWPQWRGPDRDAVWHETGLLQAFPPDGLKVLWRVPVGVGFSSPCVAQGRVYVTDSQVTRTNARERVHCLDAATGKPIWTERIGSQTWSSVVLADGNLYSLDSDGQCAVFKAGPKLEVISRNKLDERTRSSVVISNGEVLIRTHKHLWVIGD